MIGREKNKILLKCKEIFPNSIVFFFLIVCFGLIVGLKIWLGESYIYTQHDYLDSWPSLFSVLKRDGIYWSPNGKMSIMDGMSSVYLYFDFGIYRLLNFFFDFIVAEIVNKTLAITIGYFAMIHFLQYYFKDDFSRNPTCLGLIAIAYAITPVYPVWSISFAVLPFLLELFLRFMKYEIKFGPSLLWFLLFSFFVYFPCIGIFVLGVWVIGFVVNCIFKKQLNIAMGISIFLMFISVCIFNINILIYVTSGNKLNRELFQVPSLPNIGELIDQFKTSLFYGQYHAKPVLKLIFILILSGFFLTFLFCKRINRNKMLNSLKQISVILCFVISFTIVETFYEVGVWSWIESKICPFLVGFNEGRIFYFNNLLWYVLLAVIIILLSDINWIRICSVIAMCMQLILIIVQTGAN